MNFFGTTCLYPQKIAPMLARGLVVLLMISHALLAFSNAISPSHDPLRAGTHVHASVDADTGDDDHGHNHEALDDEGAMHQHGHNLADHSHDKPNFPPSHVLNIALLSDQWLADKQSLAYPVPCATPERPPKRLPTV